MKKLVCVAVAGLLLAGCGPSETKIDIPGNGKTESTVSKYTCSAGNDLTVTYLNNEPNSVAVVEMPDQPKIVMVDVMAASGAKYVGGVYEWWTKGDDGTLRNLQGDQTSECRMTK